MTAELALRFSLITSICMALLSVLCAIASWKQASAAMRLKKKISVIEMDSITSSAELSQLKDMVNRLSKRQALADYKAGQADDKQEEMFQRDKRPGPNASKDELRQYWLKGRSHQEIATLAKGT